MFHGEGTFWQEKSSTTLMQKKYLHKTIFHQGNAARSKGRKGKVSPEEDASQTIFSMKKTSFAKEIYHDSNFPHKQKHEEDDRRLQVSIKEKFHG